MKQSAASPHAPDRSVVGWFKRLFRPAPRTTLTRAPANTQEKSPQVATANTDTSGWAELAPDFAPYAQALGIDLAEPAPLSDAQHNQVTELTAAVTAHAAQDDSGPKALPTVSLRFLHLVAQHDVEVTELATAIQQDPALTTAVLRVANSVAYGPTSGEIHTVRDAVLRLGVGESGRVAGAIAAKTLFSSRSKSAHALFAQPFADLHLAAASAAAGAAYLAMTRSVGRSDYAYLGGMLHDVGKSIALGALAELVLKERAPRELAPEVLQGMLEGVHVDLGAQALDRWGMPHYLTALCASHHDATVPQDPSQAELHLVRVVSGLVALRTRPQPLTLIAQIVQSLGALSLTPIQTRALDAELRSTTARLKEALS